MFRIGSVSIHNDNNIEIDHEDNQEGERLFCEIKRHLEEVQKIVDDEYNAKNYRWIRSTNRNFNGIRRIVNDINTYRRRTHNPRTWRDHNNNTLFLD